MLTLQITAEKRAKGGKEKLYLTELVMLRGGKSKYKLFTSVTNGVKTRIAYNG